MNTAVCRKCGVEHDARDVKNGICFWCEQKETNEILAPVEQTINNFDGIKENKELTESISDIKQELKKLKKTIKDLE